MYYLKVIRSLYMVCLLQAFRCGNLKSGSKPSSVQTFKGFDNVNGFDKRLNKIDDTKLPDNKKSKTDGNQKNNEGIDDDASKPGSFNFKDAIEKLREAADATQGITWRLTGDTLIRVVTEQAGKRGSGSADYAVQILNIYRAAQKLCELYQKPTGKFIQMAQQFMQKEYPKAQATHQEDAWLDRVYSVNKITVGHLHDMLTNLIKDKNLAYINDMLRIAENYVGLDDTHYNIITKFKLKESEYALKDEKYMVLTQTQKNAFVQRKSQQWYQRLEPFEQKLIDAYVDKLTDGAHYIPTQLRHLPGCRNTYKKEVIKNDKKIGYYGHMATFTSPCYNGSDGNVSEELAEDNWAQVKAHASMPLVGCLNNTFDIPQIGYIGEKHIINQTNRILEKSNDQDCFIHFPINDYASVASPIFQDPVAKLLQHASDRYRKTYPDLCEMLNNEKSNCDDIQCKVSKIQNLQDKNAFTRLNELRKYAKEPALWQKTKNFWSTVTNRGNPYLDLAAQFAACNAYFNSGYDLNFSCKSGKDRTGAVSLMADEMIISMHAPELNRNEIASALTKTGHWPLLASLNAGMSGRRGLKPVRGLPKVYQPLFSQAATTTMIPLENKGIWKTYYHTLLEYASQ